MALLFNLDMPPRMSPLERLITGLVNALPEDQLGTDYNRQCDGSCGYRQAVRRPWVHEMNIVGFSPKEVSVKVESNHVCVHARHEERNGEDFDISECRRSVKIPDGVNKEKVTSGFGRGGRFFIKAPFIEQETAKPGKKPVYIEVPLIRTTSTGSEKTSNKSETSDSSKTNSGKEDAGVAKSADDRKDADTTDSKCFAEATNRSTSPATSDDFTLLDKTPVNNE